MIDFGSLENETAKIREMSLKSLFDYGEKLYDQIKYYREKEKMNGYRENELDGDCRFTYEYKLEQTNIAIFNKVVKPSDPDFSCLKYFDNDFSGLARPNYSDYNEYIDKALRKYFLQNLDKNDRFCYEVVSLFISKDAESNGNIEEVEEWFEIHNSQEFKKNIEQDVFSIIHYMLGIEHIIDDYVKKMMSEK
ncbi:MAG: hypothetical protein SPJ19_05605 [Candidatus Borkfalkiaceae bacterium]|nr:hypothetical protein [Christensenellaceae bacterium]